MIDKKGYRAGVGIILVNQKGQLFWARRVRQQSYQFPQGGMQEGETPEQAMYRELYEEVGLRAEDVRLISVTRHWLHYQLPTYFIRHGTFPLCIGQKQKWFLLELVGDEQSVNFNTTDTPEFDAWEWVHYWHPLSDVINFKKRVYRLVLREFEYQVPQAKKSPAYMRGYLARRLKRRSY